MTLDLDSKIVMNVWKQIFFLAIYNQIQVKYSGNCGDDELGRDCFRSDSPVVAVVLEISRD